MTTEQVAQTGIDLLRIVRINEEIKRVVAVSFKINIMALNAIFLAKRAGTAARGFAVLSNEFRSFSEELRSSMAALTSMVYSCVNEVSMVLQEMRFTRLLQEASQLSSHASLAPMLRRRGLENVTHQENLARLRSQLRRALDDAFQMVELGGVLAKSAKIEAAYGQSFAASLSQVSGEFDHIVEEIRASLESLRRSAFFAGN